jgi:hypothetical protein
MMWIGAVNETGEKKIEEIIQNKRKIGYSMISLVFECFVFSLRYVYRYFSVCSNTGV